jgi:hypothetical protein
MGRSGSTCDDVGARGCRWTRRRGASPPLFQTVERLFFFAGQELQWLLYGGTTELAAEENRRTSRWRPSMLLSKAMQR